MEVTLVLCIFFLLQVLLLNYVDDLNTSSSWACKHRFLLQNNSPICVTLLYPRAWLLSRLKVHMKNPPMTLQTGRTTSHVNLHADPYFRIIQVPNRASHCYNYHVPRVFSDALFIDGFRSRGRILDSSICTSPLLRCPWFPLQETSKLLSYAFAFRMQKMDFSHSVVCF